MRNMSVFEEQRASASSILDRPIVPFTDNRDKFLKQMGEALYAGMLIAYAQGFAILKAASEKYEYSLDLEAVARVWRGSCIIRAALLDEMCAAFSTNPDLQNLLLDPNLSRKIMEHQQSLRGVVCKACESGVPTPGLLVSLGYLDAFRSVWLPANLIQAQRDYFGAHTFERNDAKGTFHMEWERI